MSDAFLKVLNMSIAAGWLVLAVVALRLLFKKAPKWIACALWAVVAIRLICPFSLESALSLIPSAETVGPEILYAQEPVIHSGVPAINSALNPVISGSFTPSPGASVNPLQIWTAIAAYVWLAGVAAMLIYAAVSFLRLRKKVGASLHVRDGVWVCDDIKTPFILGVFRPRIYLPSGMDTETEAYVVAHETAHLKRRDHLWKPLGFLILSVYWFNPLCWLAYILLCRDIELACDERVIRGMEKDAMLSYSEALLSCSVPRGQISACPLAFGEVGVKERIKTVLNYKKPAFWIIVVAVVACVVVAVCFLTNPKAEPSSYLSFDREASAGDTVAYYSAGFGDEIQQAAIYIEEWQNGVCTDDVAAIYATPFESLSIMQNIPRENDVWAGLNVGVYVDGNGSAPLLAALRFPDGARFYGESSCCYGIDSEKEKLEITTGTEYIMAAMVFDGGGGIRVFSCEALMDEPERLASYQYAVVVRVVFSSEEPLILGEIDPHASALSLRDVIALSQKGKALTWADFDNYPYIETGSGLYIRVYEIDELFSLWIGGSSTEESPMYIRLVSKANTDYYIDIRTEDVDVFIAERQSFTDVPLTVVSDGKAVTPYKNSLWSQNWDGAGWLAADGMSVRYTLPEIAAELPTVTLDDDFEIHYGENASFSYLSIFDASYERILHNVTLDRINTLPRGLYYVSVVIKVQGAYIEAGSDYEATGYECVFKLIVPDADPLDTAVSAAIKAQHWDGNSDGLIHCESHVTLATVSATPKVGESKHKVIVYAMVLYQEYSFSGATFHEVSGSHIPTALTFEVDADGTHTLTEYWIPRDGSYYAPDIREKFPADIAEDAMDTQKYILAQKQNCYAQAVEYGKVDTDAVIGQLLETITSSPATSSNPGDYIDAHPIEYRELTYYGDYTLRYIFSEFLKGGQTDLRGYIMRSVMDTLIDSEALKLAADNGQKYFDAWREHTEKVYEQNGADYMQENCPKGWLLLQMIG